MDFFEKIKGAFRKIKVKLIVYTILTLVIFVWLLAPLTTSIIDAEYMAGLSFKENAFDSTLWEQFLVNIAGGITSPLREFGKCFKPFYSPTYFTLVKAGLVAYVFFALIGLVKAIPKHEYENIENGSSDWSEGGEQYKILSRNKGIVLAEKNYLPVDKRGNVNVLVVRRFWCW